MPTNQNCPFSAERKRNIADDFSRYSFAVSALEAVNVLGRNYLRRCDWCLSGGDVSKLRTTTDGRQIFKCPCGHYHSLRVQSAPSPSWDWNGDVDKPTFSPSINAQYWNGPENDPRFLKFRCHSFVRDGKIQFLNDCTHELRGQTVEIPEWPHAPGEFGGLKE